jgi:hypothetical protein
LVDALIEQNFLRHMTDRIDLGKIIAIWKVVCIDGVIRKVLGRWGRFYSSWSVPSILQLLFLMVILSLESVLPPDGCHVCE